MDTSRGLGQSPHSWFKTSGSALACPASSNYSVQVKNKQFLIPGPGSRWDNFELTFANFVKIRSLLKNHSAKLHVEPK